MLIQYNLFYINYWNCIFPTSFTKKKTKKYEICATDWDWLAPELQRWRRELLVVFSPTVNHACQRCGTWLQQTTLDRCAKHAHFLGKIFFFSKINKLKFFNFNLILILCSIKITSILIVILILILFLFLFFYFFEKGLWARIFR